MKILITGGAGYIGSTLTAKLLLEGHEVVVLDTFRFSAYSLFHLCSHKNLEIINGDVREYSSNKKFLSHFDLIIPLAANVGAPLCSKRPTESREINLETNLRLIRNMGSTQSLIMPTTNSAYGKGGAEGYCDENSPLKPISQYAKEKVELERVLMEFPNSISLRLATVFGMSVRMRFDLLVNDFTLKAKRDGTLTLYEPHFKRNYIHVRDVAMAFVHCITNFVSMRGQIYNVGLEDANLTKLELATKVASYVPNTTINIIENAKDPDQRDYLVSNKKILATGWAPQYSVDDGIVELLKGLACTKLYEYGNV